MGHCMPGLIFQLTGHSSNVQVGQSWHLPGVTMSKCFVYFHWPLTFGSNFAQVCWRARLTGTRRAGLTGTRRAGLTGTRRAGLTFAESTNLHHNTLYNVAKIIEYGRIFRKQQKQIQAAVPPSWRCLL